MNNTAFFRMAGLLCAASLVVSAAPMSASADKTGAYLSRDTSVYVKQAKPETPDIPGTRHYIDAENMLQMPDLPTGCESVSLTIVMNHEGYDADKFDIVRNYLPKQEFYYIDDQLYGADFVTTFAGDPEDEDSYGCYAPCMVTTANSYLTDKGFRGKAYDLTGAGFEYLLSEYTERGIPLMIWITNYGLEPSSLSTIWITPEGKTVQWRRPEHCVVLTGYDREKGVVYTADPIYGDTAYDYDTLIERYIEMGSQAVFVNAAPDFGIQLSGDVDRNGVVTSGDALTILRVSAGIGSFDSFLADLADINGDGAVTSDDALAALRVSMM